MSNKIIEEHNFSNYLHLSLEPLVPFCKDFSIFSLFLTPAEFLPFERFCKYGDNYNLNSQLQHKTFMISIRAIIFQGILEYVTF